MHPWSSKTTTKKYQSNSWRNTRSRFPQLTWVRTGASYSLVRWTRRLTCSTWKHWRSSRSSRITQTSSRQSPSRPASNKCWQARWTTECASHQSTLVLSNTSCTTMSRSTQSRSANAASSSSRAAMTPLPGCRLLKVMKCHWSHPILATGYRSCQLHSAVTINKQWQGLRTTKCSCLVCWPGVSLLWNGSIQTSSWPRWGSALTHPWLWPHLRMVMRGYRMLIVGNWNTRLLGTKDPSGPCQCRISMLRLVVIIIKVW